MQIKKTKFKGLFIIKKKFFRDNRGFFYRDFCKNELSKLNFNIKQINFSYNNKEFTLRGFHFQKSPYQEDKIISCISGEILNVSIDLRKNSKTYLKVFSKVITSKDNTSLLIPKGFANAYLTLKKNTKILYYMSEFYKPSYSSGIRYDDPFFDIKWPVKPKIISKKDKVIKNFKFWKRKF